MARVNINRDFLLTIKGNGSERYIPDARMAGFCIKVSAAGSIAFYYRWVLMCPLTYPRAAACPCTGESMSGHKPIPFEELVVRNALLYDAGKNAVDTVQRYQHSNKKIRALARPVARMDTADSERPHLISALNDAIDRAELEVDGELPLLMMSLARGTGMNDRERDASAPLH